jgi:predicted RNase H-like HicB family nuclease
MRSLVYSENVISLSIHKLLARRIEQDEDGVFIAKVPNIPGWYTQGKNLEETMERIKEAIQVCL